MSEQKKIPVYFELRPVTHPDGQTPRQIPESLTASQINVVDADFAHGGTWAGVATLMEKIYFDLLERGQTEVLEKHNYELHMVLVRHRERIPLKRGSLTDMARGAEKTRNFPLDRAYRIAHGLIDLVIQWRMTTGDKSPCILVVENFSWTQHLARRFFLDLARRASVRANLILIVASEGEPLNSGPLEARLRAVPVALPPSLVRSNVTQMEGFASDAEAEQFLESIHTLDAIELNYNRLMAYYKSTGDGFHYAKTALYALHASNHLGYYYEASSFIDPLLPYFDRLVDGSEDNRWNYTGNLYHSLVVQGAVDEARQIIERLAKPFLTQKALRAKMEYVLGIIELRHKTPPDLAAAEKHLLASVDLIRSTRDELEPHEYAFLNVFIENGLAFLRVRQGRKEEAIQLCQTGYELLTRELGPEKHQLHRSVLQYNTAQVYSMMGDTEAALEHYAYSIQMDPNYSEYYNEVANIHQRLGQYGEALKYYETAMKLSPPYPEVYFNRGVCLAREGKWQTALESCTYSLELNPDQPDAYVLQAEIHEQLGNEDEALASYDKAIDLFPKLVVAHVNKAVLSFNKQLFDQALAEMNHVIAIEESEPNHYENRAAIYKEMGEIDSFQEDQERAESLRRDQGVLASAMS